MSEFKNSFAENVFRFKYAQGPGDTWGKLADNIEKLESRKLRNVIMGAGDAR